MNGAPTPKTVASAPCSAGGWRVPAVAGILLLAALGAYWNSFNVPFMLDDEWVISDNSSIRHLGEIGDVLSPSTVGPTAGRPLLNLAFAVNYSLGGESVRGYHVVNWLIHVCAGLALLGIVRRTLFLPRLRSRYGAAALPLAACVALLWMLHPLQTESVTYISQRAESLMGLFYLLTLYGFIRSVRSDLTDNKGNEVPGQARRSSLPFVKTPVSWGAGWLVLSVAACFCGMAVKQVMVTAPVLVLLYDYAFASGSFRSALVNRRWYYAGLAASWLLLGFLMHQSSLADVAAGFQAGVSWLTYALTELRVVALYLKLAFWPHPLVFDYSTEIFLTAPLAAVPYALIIAASLAGVAVAWRRSPMLGFLGCWFFLILSPTSTVVPIAEQPMAESRMYLPLAAVAASAVFLAYRFIRHRTLVLAALGLVVVVFGALTIRRNHDYRSELGIWEDTLAKHPGSSRAHSNLGHVLGEMPGRLPEAIAHYEEALRLRPDYATAHNNLATGLAKMPGRQSEAIAHYEEALRIRPNYPTAHDNLGMELAKMPGRLPEAIAHYEEALRLRPGYVEAHFNLANALVKIPGRLPEAIAHYEEALNIKPDYTEARNNLADALAQTPGGQSDAIAQYEEALRARPDSAEVHANFANALMKMPGRQSDAIAHYEEALRLNPSYAEAHNNLATALAQVPGRQADAIAHYEEAVRLKPDYADAHCNLASMLWEMPGRRADAVAHAEEALRLRPDFPEAHFNLANALVEMPGRVGEAIAHYEEAVRLKPDYADARNNLAAFYVQTGRVDAAIEQMEAVARLVPESTVVRDYLEKLKASRKRAGPR